MSVTTSRSCSFAIDEAGRIWATGQNDHGQLGLGDSRNRDRWTPGEFEHPVAAVCLGDRHTAALDQYGRLWTCGVTDLDYGRSGLRGGAPVTPPTARWHPAGLEARCVSVAASWLGLLAVDADERLWVRGTTAFGELGLGRRESECEWIACVTAVRRVWSESTASFVLTADERLLATGLNAPSDTLGYPRSGQLGVGHFDDCWSWTATTFEAQVADVAVGYGHTLVLDTDGRVWGAGDNSERQLGLDGVEVTADFVDCGLAIRARAVAAGCGISFAIGVDGALWVCGAKTDGYGGRGGVPRWQGWRPSTLPVPVRSLATWADHVLVVSTDGRLWISGSGFHSTLGVHAASDAGDSWLEVPPGDGFDVFATLCADGVPRNRAAEVAQALG